ncbi:hypothetical protein J4456_01830 [Candidatus Pacearchaeota archaeon]|nr:hypothetical protein [Candidatus Pacearchaeota archaeon]
MKILDDQIGAIKRSVILGRTLQEEHPELVDLYRNGKSLTEISDELEICVVYNVSESVSRNAISLALIGYGGAWGFESYTGILKEDEVKLLGEEHKSQNGKENGRILMENKKGIFALTTEQKIQTGRKSGNKTYNEKTGVHGRSAEKRKEDSSKGYQSFLKNRSKKEKSEYGVKGVVEKGQTPYSDEEIKYAYQLSLKKVYINPPGSRNPGKANCELIAKEINRIFHKGDEVRDRRTISTRLYRYRKSLENIV